MIATLLGAALLQGCDPMLYANARAPLVAPVDSVCLKAALQARFGPPDMRPIVEKRGRKTPAALWLYYGRAAFAQTYHDSGSATLRASKPVASGLQALFAPPHARQDSVSRQLGRDVLAMRDACGGRTPEGVSEVEFSRQQSDINFEAQR
ncbi:MAG TPA: hypothetical protein VGQ18_14445 [Gemmatimonadales bacterium]|nr:hypothetical protein [Gemmatimonadales bacterium]